ncbi:E3 ubiquitin-protein ligase TRIM31 [Dipodomys spectabilis]|uniref:E3 ubiquitin-protein ligase TRIM31 n=1 Tax=Dipodomys spectabilis TaxID=105255 RepID=UPI001C54081B|nr:E3 ubiquitin-protein ligase TRIM31 [Dipodomys spectabilis]
MASQQLTSNLQDEVICSICMDTLQEPVTTDCGHTFCLRCISQVGSSSDELLKCPLCQKFVQRSTIRPNWLVVNLVERIQAIDPSEIQPEEREMRCPKHGEKIHYFCEQDGEFLCVVCRDSKDHRSHNPSLIEEAAQNYQGQIQSKLEVLLQKEKEIILEKIKGEHKNDFFLNQVRLEKQRIKQHFRFLRQSLEKEENFFLARLHWLEMEGAKGKKFYSISTQAQLNSLEKLIKSLKNKQQMQPRQLLEDIKTLLSRSNVFQFLNPTPVPEGLEKKFNEAKSSHNVITENLRKFKENLQTEKKKDEARFLKGLDEKDKKSFAVTLDADTAHPDLSLSLDLKTVTLDFIPQSDSAEPTNPKCFYPFRCVLGLPGFSMGRQAWEVEIQGPRGGASVVGVASELVPRRGHLRLEPLLGFWALRIFGSTCQALIENCTRKDLPVCPRKVGVLVDYNDGKIIFYDATNNNHIYTFQASFPGPIFPFLRLLLPGTQVTLSP